MQYVNADEIAREISTRSKSDNLRDFEAGRRMLRDIDALVAKRLDFMFETTLATLTYIRKISSWKAQGYTTILTYVRLPSADRSLARVQRRVQAGGHYIPESVIRRRFDRSLQNLQAYQNIVDQWYVWDSVEGDFTLAERWDEHDHEI